MPFVIDFKLPASIAEAKRVRSSRYFTAIPCKRGHVAPRTTSGRRCTICIKEIAAAFRKTPIGKLKDREARQRWLNKSNNRKRAVEMCASWASTDAGIAFYRAKAASAKAHKLKACPPWIDQASIKAIYTQAKRLSDIIGIDYEVDHVVPLKHPLISGLHVPWNLEIIPKWQNRSKSNKFEVS